MVVAVLVYIIAFGALSVQSFPTAHHKNESPFEQAVLKAKHLRVDGQCQPGETACGSNCCLMTQSCCGGNNCCLSNEECCGFDTCCYRTQTCCGDVNCCSGTCNGTHCIEKEKHPWLAQGQIP